MSISGHFVDNQLTVESKRRTYRQQQRRDSSVQRNKPTYYAAQL